MKAAILTTANTPLSIAEIEHAPIGFGQVHVQVLATGICGAQLQEIRGEKGNHFPRLMGHEGCGRVLAVGEGVNTVKPGDKVVLHWRVGSGIESDFPKWRFAWDSQQWTSGKITTFAEEVVVSENRCTAVPDETPNELCALLGCGLSTALGVMENEAKLRGGESVLIVGCGGVGLNLIRVAKMMGASYIYATDLKAEKSQAAISAGATGFCADGGRPFGRFDIVVDTTGWFLYFDELALSGRYIMVGQAPPGAGIQITNARSMFDGQGKTIKATQGGGFNPDADIPRYVKMWRSGYLRLDGIITHRLSLDQINDGIELVKNGQAGRVIIEP